jgi:hypothetical protein
MWAMTTCSFVDCYQNFENTFSPVLILKIRGYIPPKHSYIGLTTTVKILIPVLHNCNVLIPVFQKQTSFLINFDEN